MGPPSPPSPGQHVQMASVPGAPTGIEISDAKWDEVYVGLPPQWELVGRGSFGKVYRAKRVSNNVFDAVKVIPMDENEGLDDVKREVAILRDCNSPHIVSYRGCYFTGAELWISMEFCGGGSVEQITTTTEEPLSEEQISTVCREALKGLTYLHQHNKIHRDVKGGNILLTDSGQVKLADFGVSAQLATTMSQRNTFVGTTYWMAPEVILERQYDGRADIWSLGITAIEMAELAPPHHNLHPMRALFQIPRGPPPGLNRNTGWSVCFHDFVKSCLVKECNQRPQAYQLLEHTFVKNAPSGTRCLLQAVSQWRLARMEKEKEEKLKKEGGKRPAHQPPPSHAEDSMEEADCDADDDTVHHSSRTSATSATFVENVSDGSATFVDNNEVDDDSVDGIAMAAADAAARRDEAACLTNQALEAHNQPHSHHHHLEMGTLIDLPYVKLDSLHASSLLRPLSPPIASKSGTVEPRALYKIVAEDQGIDYINSSNPVAITPTVGSLLREYVHSAADDPPPPDTPASGEAIRNILKTICA